MCPVCTGVAILGVVERSGSRSGALAAAVVLLLGAALLMDHAVAAWVLRCRAPALDALVALINPIGSGVTLLIVCIALVLVGRALGRSRLHDAAMLGAIAFASAGLVD